MANVTQVRCDECGRPVEERHPDAICITGSQDHAIMTGGMRGLAAHLSVLRNGRGKVGQGRIDFCDIPCLLKALGEKKNSEKDNADS